MKELRRRIKHEEEDPDCEYGIAVFIYWVWGSTAYWGTNREELLRATDGELAALWARFMLEADEEQTTKVQEVYEHPVRDHDSDCCCADCQEERQDEAEWYREMKEDR